MAKFEDVSSTHSSLFRESGGFAASSSHPAWEKFFRKYHPCIRDFCLHVLRLSASDADEVTQRIMVKLLDKMAGFQYDPQKSFRGWLKTVVRRAAIDFFREKKSSAEVVLANDDEKNLFDGLTEERLVEVLDDRWVKEVRDSLYANVAPEVQQATSSDHWKAWTLLEEGEKPRDIAKTLGISTANVYQVRKRINDQHRVAIRKLIERDGLPI